MNPFEEKIEQLIKSEIEEVQVKRDELMYFREVWRVHPERLKIVGEAAHGGNITYRYKKDQT